MQKPLFLIVLTVLALWSASVKADIPAISHESLEQPEQKEQKRFYDDSKRGWYWYEIEKKKEEEKKQEVKKPAPENKKDEKKEVKHRLPSLKDYSYDDLNNMHPDDFQELLMDFQKKAIMKPTEVNVSEYYLIQDMARRKAVAFTNVATFVMQKNQDLQLENDYPGVHYGRQEYLSMANKDKVKKLSGAVKDFGFIYFYSPTCKYCFTQNSILKSFVEKYKWEVVGVNVEENMEKAAKFDIDSVPVVLLVHKGSEDFFPITKGPISLETMEDRAYQGIRFFLKETSPENFEMSDFEKGGAFDTDESPLRNQLKKQGGGK